MVISMLLLKCVLLCSLVGEHVCILFLIKNKFLWVDDRLIISGFGYRCNVVCCVLFVQVVVVSV